MCLSFPTGPKLNGPIILCDSLDQLFNTDHVGSCCSSCVVVNKGGVFVKDDALHIFHVNSDFEMQG